MSGDTAQTRTPEQIRRDIEHTREELAETAAALAEKADVKARAHEKLDEAKARITGTVDTAKARVAGTAGVAKERAADATPSSVAGGAQSAADTAQAKVKANPIPAAVVAGFAAGALVAWIIAARR